MQEDLIIQILDSTEKIKAWEKCYRAAEDVLKKSFLASNKENGTVLYYSHLSIVIVWNNNEYFIR